MPKPLSRQSKQLVANLISYFERERNNNGPLLPLNAVRERVANALQLNVKTSKEKETETEACVTEAVKVAIRDSVYVMYKNKRFIFDGCRESLRKEVLKNIGFRWKKNDSRRGLMELDHLAFARLRFLQDYIANLNEADPCQFVYLDETWIFENGCLGRSVKRIKSEGKRYIILHAGTVNGFIPDASLIFSSNTKNLDYHSEMNQGNFLKWFEHQLLMNLEEPSIIIMDNASYHSSLLDKTPNSKWNKPQIVEWLRNHNIECECSLLKIYLLELVSLNKPPKTFIVWIHLLNNADIECSGFLLIIVYFTRSKMYGGIAKRFYNDHVGRDGGGMEKAVDMWKEALSTVTPQKLKNCIDHAEKEIKSWWEREKILDIHDIAPIIIHLSTDSESFDSEYCDET